MSYMEIKEKLQEIDTSQDNHVRKMTDSFVERAREAYQCAIREGIEVNSIVINKNIVKVPETWIKMPSGGARMLPTMFCGLNVFLTENELPETYAFALVEGPRGNTRLEQFESIGMEPDELRKAAELYRRIKEVME